MVRLRQVVNDVPTAHMLDPSASSGQSGKVVTNTYDAANRLSAVRDWASQVTSYTYDAAGRPLTITFPNGIATTYRHDNAGRLVNLTYAKWWTLASYTYTLDAVGNRTISTQTITSTLVMTHTYNAANRLTNRAVSDGRVYTYTWSNAGQLLAERTQGIATRVFTYTAAGQLAETSLFTLTTRFSYDGDPLHCVRGQVARAAWSTSWDAVRRPFDKLKAGSTRWTMPQAAASLRRRRRKWQGLRWYLVVLCVVAKGVLVPARNALN